MNELEKKISISLMEYSDILRSYEYILGVQFSFEFNKNDIKLLLGAGIKKEYLVNDDMDELALTLKIYRSNLNIEGDICTIGGEILKDFIFDLNKIDIMNILNEFDGFLDLYVNFE